MLTAEQSGLGMPNIIQAFCVQKDTILGLLNDDGIDQAVTLFLFVRDSWERAGYGYKVTEVTSSLKLTCWQLIRDEQSFIANSRSNGRGVSNARHRIDALSTLVNRITVE